MLYLVLESKRTNLFQTFNFAALLLRACMRHVLSSSPLSLYGTDTSYQHVGEGFVSSDTNFGTYVQLC